MIYNKLCCDIVKRGEDLVDPDRRSFLGRRAKLFNHQNAQCRLRTSTVHREPWNHGLSLDADMTRITSCIAMVEKLSAYPLRGVRRQALNGLSRRQLNFVHCDGGRRQGGEHWGLTVVWPSATVVKVRFLMAGKKNAISMDVQA